MPNSKKLSTTPTKTESPGLTEFYLLAVYYIAALTIAAFLLPFLLIVTFVASLAHTLRAYCTAIYEDTKDILAGKHSPLPPSQK